MRAGFACCASRRAGKRDLITVIGHAASISAGEWVQMSGTWVNDRTHGRQFKARFMRALAPSSVEAVEKYFAWA